MNYFSISSCSTIKFNKHKINHITHTIEYQSYINPLIQQQNPQLQQNPNPQLVHNEIYNKIQEKQTQNIQQME